VELLHTTLSILCLLNPQVPSNQEVHEYLMRHTTNTEIGVLNNYNPTHSFDFTNEIIDNKGLRVDFDSAEHIPSAIKTYFLENPGFKKELYLAIYNLEQDERDSSQVIEYLSSESSASIEYMLPSQVHFNDVGISSIWSISTDMDNKKQIIVLNLFFDSGEELSFWLSDMTTSKYNNFFQEAFNLITMKFVELPFRCFYYLNYDKKPKHRKHRHMSDEEAQQCDKFINKIISPKTNNKKLGGLPNLTYALDQVQHDGLFLEFGVYRGGSIRHIARVQPKKTIHGFDSFEGLQEEWNGSKPGHFNMNGHLPNVQKNVRLYKGYFDDSLPLFKEKLPEDEVIAFMHVDSDLYSSAKDIFKHLGDLIVPGTIIVFDDFLYNVRWIEHEPLAFVEFLNERDDLTFEYISFTGVHQVAVRILQKR
jgi:hypothetical protein